ncbi:MAG: BNR repeat-containing protein [Bacteroidales bacterium]|jgi:hypothetical protein|nr:BNR repeat-containing protein [Bacteroidales bacterium]
MNRTIHTKIFLLILLFSCPVFVFSQEYPIIQEVCDISYVPSSFPVGFALCTHGNQQFVAYYDSAKNMTVASRKTDNCIWDYQILDNKIGWDSHNYVVLKIDSEGYIHVVGNLHASPLIYYRSLKPLDIHSLTRIPKMVGTEEDRMTYPVFMNGPDGAFIFHYRHGGSGNGYEIYNVWDAKKQVWERYLNEPLIDGKGKRNAYMDGPVPGPDNYYHMIWVWRETPDCATNHTLSYARSKDLSNWENIAGEKVTLPITIEESSLYVDDTPPGGGLFNPGIKLGFDPSGKVLIGYHKYDQHLNTQLFIARYENGKWLKKQVTNWDFHWVFQGNGSVFSQLSVDRPKSLPNGQVAFGYHRVDAGSGEILLDGRTMDPVGSRPYTRRYPDELDMITSDYPEMSVRKTFDSGRSSNNKEFYLLRWETLPANRDARRNGTLPHPSILKIYKLAKD